MDIKLTNISKTYPNPDGAESQPVLQLESLHLEGGHVHGVLGHSGSGKSTLLNLIAMLDPTDRHNPGTRDYYPNGDSLPGQRGDGRREDDYRGQYFSFVFQSEYLLENFNVLDNVLMPLRLRGKITSGDRTAAQERLESLGINSSHWTKLPHKLSGGERQRVAVARALVHKPMVVFADEPTGSLDPGKGTEVMEQLVAWKNSDPKNLLVLVTHNPNHVQLYCDRFTVLHGGKEIAAGCPADFTLEALISAMSGSKPT
jgi:ABC-type lipoprotein export system ATPase subunit